MAINLGKYSTEELQSILATFKVAMNSYSFVPLTNGYINDTFLVLDDETPLFILQRINHSVFENVEGLMGNIDAALKQMKAQDYVQIKLIPNQTGKTYTSLPSGYWRVMTYIVNSTTHDTTHDTTQNLEVAYEAGRIIGKFHALLGKASNDSYVDTIPKFHNLELRKMQFLASLARASKEQKKTAEHAISFTQETLEKIETMDINELPIRICHNDTKLNNILFSKATNKALCLIDLDTIMKGYFHYDFGDAVRTIVNTAPEDEQEHAKITFDKNLFEAFINGLAYNDSFLSKEEIQALPLGVILMPFLHGIRALTDYLNNNIYYKVAYENQNLDRSLSLFDFTQKALNEVDYMNNTVTKYLPAHNE